jgi:CubicO group peptidase (beta-lactamase class C family)
MKGQKMTSTLGEKNVHGTVVRGFEAVRDAFAQNLSDGSEVAAAFAVFRDGEPLVDLWGGHADAARTVPTDEATLFALWSTTKGLAAICIALLVERSKLNYEQRVSDIWPEFAANGKQAITVGELMSHQAGLVATRDPATIEAYFAHEPIAAALAAQQPFFRPGEWGYHTLTYGTLADELVRRVDGRTIGHFFAEELSGPLGLDAFMGLPLDQDHRQAETIGQPDPTAVFFDTPNAEVFSAALLNPLLDWDWPNQRRWREHGVPGAGGSANARSLAKLYGLLVAKPDCGLPQVLSASVLGQATRERIIGVDRVSGAVGRYAAGFRLNTGTMGANSASFGHAGMGGSTAFADPDRRLGIAYTPNRMMAPDWQLLDPRLNRLLTALYVCVGAATS